MPGFRASMGDIATDLTDSDDLDIIDSVRKDLSTDAYINSRSLSPLVFASLILLVEIVHPTTATESEDQSDHVPVQRPRMRDNQTTGEQVDWSDDGGSDEVYKTFKDRKSAKRRKIAPGVRNAKAREKNGIAHTSKQSKQSGRKEKSRKQKDWGVVSGDDENDLMEHTLPEYLQERRSKFDKRMVLMKEAGLKLPPSYEDIDFSDDERLEHLKEKPDFPGGKQSAPYKDKLLPKSLGLIPAPIAQWLRDYQIEGTAFLHTMFVYQTGGILGDDMGLGKTVQVIAFLTAAFGKTGDERDAKRMRKIRRAGSSWYPRILVICPGALIENWKAELNRWGWWHIYVYHGNTDAKEAALDAAASGRMEIMITTYTTYRLSKDAINMIEWDCVIADECHMVKGRNSETTKAMNEVNALCRIGLTGTAIQNSYDELWTLLNWTNPGKFGPISTWRKTISEPLRAGQSHDATIYQLSKARKTAKALVENLLPAFFLRRMKSIIADQLPKKSDRVVFCPMTPTQTDAYENCVDNEYIQYIKDSSLPCHCGSTKKQGWCCNTHLPNGVKWQSYVFPAIVNLQKLSNHLAMLIPQSNDPKEKQDKDLEMLQIAVPDQWRHLYRNRDSILNFSNPDFCGKWKILKKLLRFWHSNGDKVLVFSHSVRLLKMLQLLFNHTSYPVSYLDGSMTLMDRAKVVDDFNSDPSAFVFLISTKAGGVGLNITSANKVVVVDPNWNPSYDLQAQDRAYRIGQTRDVEVFRLVSAGTIEEIVYARQIYKQQQANIAYTASTERRYFKGVQENKDQKGEIFGLANLFAFQGDNMVLRDIVNKTNIAESRAGVQVVGLELSQSQSQSASSPNPNGEEEGGDSILGTPEDEDSAMSQLASIIVSQAEEAAGKKPKTTTKHSSRATAGPPKKSDPVQAILAGAGVEYTHENSEVVGSSRVEASLSRRAQEAGNDIDFGGQHVFADTQERAAKPSGPSFNTLNDGYDDDDDDLEVLEPKRATDIPWRYRPPEEVRKRQFCTMAREAGYGEDVVGFATVVEGWTQEKRRAFLDRFYRGRRVMLGCV